MADNIVVSDARLADIVESYPKGGLTWTLATEVERLRFEVQRLTMLLHPANGDINAR